MRVIFMGTPDFAVGTLEALVKSEHEVVAVVTQPDKPKGRGKAMQPTPVKEVALRENIPVLQPKKVREPEVVEELSKLNADVIVVVAFGQIIPKTILELTKYGCINVHGPCFRNTAEQRRSSGPSSTEKKSPASRRCRWMRAWTPEICFLRKLFPWKKRRPEAAFSTN